MHINRASFLQGCWHCLLFGSTIHLHLNSPIQLEDCAVLYRAVKTFASRQVEVSQLVVSWNFVYHVVSYVALRNTGVLLASYDWPAI